MTKRPGTLRLGHLVPLVGQRREAATDAHVRLESVQPVEVKRLRPRPAISLQLQIGRRMHAHHPQVCPARGQRRRVGDGALEKLGHPAGAADRVGHSSHVHLFALLHKVLENFRRLAEMVMKVGPQDI